MSGKGSSNHMRAGVVVRIRVNPKDCQSVIDLMEKIGIRTAGMSYASCVSLALSSLMEAARSQQILPEPDPFQYLNRMEKFQVMSPNQVRKLEITNGISSLGSTFKAPTYEAAVVPLRQEEAVQRTPVGTALAEQAGMTFREAQVELTELCAKKDLSEDGQYMWTPALEERFQLCYKIVYPEG